MKIVIAPDSFKGSLSAVEVAEAMARGVRRVFPDAVVDKIPLADGGEGTTDVFVTALNGAFRECTALDPLGRETCSRYGIVEIEGKKTAIIEVATASGLTLVPETERDALRASSTGTGQLIHDALEQGCRDFIIGLGGSATTDAGKGLLEALGVRFLDETGRELCAGGGSLCNLATVDVSSIDRRVAESRFIVARDVENTLFGENGAAFVFAPQKGASPDEVKTLDAGLRRFSDCTLRELGHDVSILPGGGAAGGIGAALVAYLGAELRSGIGLVIEVVGLERRLDGADLVLTGEGKIDRQTLMGKLPMGVLNTATAKNVPVIAFGGCVEVHDELKVAGFLDIVCVTPENMPLSVAMNHETAMQNIESAVAQNLHKDSES